MELKVITDGLVDIIVFIFDALKTDVDLGFNLDQFNSRAHKFLDRGIISSVLLSLGFVCMVVISILSSHNRPQGRNYFG